MYFAWDEQKRRTNLSKHGLDFADAHRVFNDDALVVKDERLEYGEDRYILLGLLSERLIVVVFTVRDEVVRVISMRKANKREQQRYVQKRLGTNR
jgi:uncharacterized protein